MFIVNAVAPVIDAAVILFAIVLFVAAICVHGAVDHGVVTLFFLCLVLVNIDFLALLLFICCLFYAGLCRLLLLMKSYVDNAVAVVTSTAARCCCACCGCSCFSISFFSEELKNNSPLIFTIPRNGFDILDGKGNSIFKMNFKLLTLVIDLKVLGVSFVPYDDVEGLVTFVQIGSFWSQTRRSRLHA